MQVNEYVLKNPDTLETPVMLVFQDQLEHNIASIIKVTGGPDRVVPHFKTHKSKEVLKQCLAAGIQSYKCATLREAEVLAEGGARQILIAYPMLHPQKLNRLMELMSTHSDIDFRIIFSHKAHVDAVAPLLNKHNKEIVAYIDLDTGMHRTGAQPGTEAIELYLAASRTPRISVVGTHLFDGHTSYQPDVAIRTDSVKQSLDHIHNLWEEVAKQGCPASDNVIGGSWSFHLYKDEPTIRMSPGTFIYWDHMNAMIPELPFKVAGVVLGQVIDRNVDKDTLTVDIGSKAITDDLEMKNRFKVAGNANISLVSQSEEHGVITRSDSDLRLGDFIFALPGHACTTTTKYPEALVIDQAGNVTHSYKHDARDR